MTTRDKTPSPATGTLVLTLILSCLLMGTQPLNAQANRDRGRQEAQQVLRNSSNNPETYQFQHVWKARIRAMRAARQRMERPGLSLSAGDLAEAGAALAGVLEFPVIAGAFTDVSGPYTTAQYQQRIFGDGSGAVSVTELYEEMSLGVFSLSGTVSPWSTLSQNREYYEPSEATHEKYGRLFEFMTEALDAADVITDFSQFDNDGPDGIPDSGDDDGIVDLTTFIYPTKAISCGGTGIWPHNWHYVSAQYFHNGVADYYYTDDASAEGGTIRIGDYTIQSGLNCDGVSIMGTGTMSHELGHALDLPDLYDVDPDDGTDSQGIGHWGLMASGGYHAQTSPAHLSAWSKDFLGWLDVQTLTASQNGLSLSPIQQGGNVYRVDLPSSSEHFLFSNRQAQGSDQDLHNTGLLIWHIDRDLAGGISETGNSVNTDATRKGVDLEEADGQDDLDWSRNRGDAGDPFPGSWNVSQFHATTYPSSRSYAGSLCGIGVRNISDASGDVTFDLTVGERWTLWGDADGSGAVSTADISPIYWYTLGLRDADEQQAITNGDVNEDGTVDLMDGFILHSSLNGLAVPANRIGQSEWGTCDPNEAPTQVAPGVRAVRGSGGFERGGSG
jgi:M6 family metalloprotease-like protein